MVAVGRTAGLMGDGDKLLGSWMLEVGCTAVSHYMALVKRGCSLRTVRCTDCIGLVLLFFIQRTSGMFPFDGVGK